MSQTGPTCPLCGREVMRRSVSLGKLQEKPTVNPQLTAGFVSPYPGLGPGYLGPDQKLSGLDKVSLSLSLSSTHLDSLQYRSLLARLSKLRKVSFFILWEIKSCTAIIGSREQLEGTKNSKRLCFASEEET